MGENPYKTPTNDRILEQSGFLTRVWKRFLANIEALAGRADSLETRVDALEAINGVEQARIATNGEYSIPVGLAANEWVPMQLGSVIAALPAVGMELVGNTRVVYRGTAANNILLTAAVYVRFDLANVTEIGFRKNGDNGTIIKLKLSSSRTEFASAIAMAYDMVTDDYIEAVIRPGAAVTIQDQNVMIYAQQTGFTPAGA